MPDLSFFSILHKIKAKEKIFSTNILYGFNEFLGEKIIKAFTENFLEKKNPFNYRRYYFDSENETNWDDIINTANTSSFFIQSRKIIVAVIREEKKINLNKNDKEILRNYLNNPNPNTILIIYISLNVTKDNFKQIKKLKIKKFINDLDSPNTYKIDLDKIFEKEVKNYIKNYLKNRDISITASALEKLIEIKGDDFPSVLPQLPKLEIAEIEGKSLDSEDIDEIITGIEAHSIWDLTDAIENEDAKKYLDVLNYLFVNGIKPTLIIGTLITHYNKIFTAKFLLKHKFSVSDIGKVLNQPSFFLNKFINSVRNFSEKRIEQILKIIYKLDYESKTSGEDSARLSLHNFIFQIKLLPSKK